MADRPIIFSKPSMRPPEFITFTGADDRTSIEGMAALSGKYPIEWGILFSQSRQGIDRRYPGGDAQSRFAWSGLRMAAHLCGSYSNHIMSGHRIEPPVDLGIFDRIQVNHSDPMPMRLVELQKGWGPRCIAQTRSASGFPTYNLLVDWLFDASGGRGIAPTAWPPYPGRLVGYAGGIGPDNVLNVIEEIGASGPYWLDMESKIRTDNWLDLDLCRAVCEKVYGP